MVPTCARSAAGPWSLVGSCTSPRGTTGSTSPRSRPARHRRCRRGRESDLFEPLLECSRPLDRKGHVCPCFQESGITRHENDSLSDGGKLQEHLIIAIA